MKHTRTNEARWDEARKRWRIDVQRDGKRRSFYSSTPGRNGKAECHRKADTWLDEGLPDGGNTRCGVLLDAYLADAESSTSYSNWRKSESISRIHLRPVIENKRIEDLTEQILQDIIHAAFKDGRSAKTLSNIRGMIVGFVKFCRKSGYTNLRPEDLTVPRGAKRGEKRILQPDDLRVLFSSDMTKWRTVIKHDWYINAYRFLVASGLRPGELIALKWSDIVNDVVMIKKSINIFGELTEGKNKNAQRKFRLNKLTRAILDNQRSVLKSAGVISPYVFCKPDGQFVAEAHLRDRWRLYCNYNGINYISPYELRHTFVSVNKETPEALLKGQVGHLLTLDSDTFNIHHIAAVMVGNLGRLLGINLPDKAVMYLDFPRVGFPV